MNALNPVDGEQTRLASARTVAGRAEAWPTICFSAIASLAAVFAFVGLSRSSYWIDELFTLFVADHGGGLTETLRRGLTDAQPPGYYLVAHLWISLVGGSEAAVRLLSALAATAALVVLFVGLRKAFSAPARMFAVATAATSFAFFEHAQNARSYAVGFLLSAIMIGLALAIDRRAGRGETAPAWLLLTMWLAGLAACFTHFYLFLATGGVYLFLLTRARTRGQQAVIALSGLSLAALVSGYTLAMMHSTALNVRDTWFSNDPRVLADQAVWGLRASWTGGSLAAIAILALLSLRAPTATFGPERERRGRANAALQLSLITVAVTLAAALVVAFAIAPSFGARNIMVLAPFLWTVAAWCYDAAALDRRPWGRFILAGLVLATTLNALALRGRFLPRQEEWRASASFIQATTACAGRPVAVVLPYRFGPSTPFFRQLAERYFFGRYGGQPWRWQAHTMAEFDAAANTPFGARLRQSAASGCPILAWGVHDVTDGDAERLRGDLARAIGAPTAQVQVKAFRHYEAPLLREARALDGAWVFVLDHAAPQPAV